MLNNRTEADTRADFIDPILKEKGWDGKIRREFTIKAGRIEVNTTGSKGECKRIDRKSADYVLFYKNEPIAVLEAKKETLSAHDGIQQALDYAERLHVHFVFSSNGKDLIFHNRLSGSRETLDIKDFPTPDELWQIYIQFLRTQNKEQEVSEDLLTPPYDIKTKEPRPYQYGAIKSALEAIAQGKKRVLLVMATGTGKTFTAYQIVSRLRATKKVRKVLFLADRNALVDQTQTGDFKSFEKISTKITKGKINTAYEIYFGLYQQLVGDKNDDENPFTQVSPDFFDLIIVDECHRGSADENSAWRKILDYFSSAIQIGLTATPAETKDVSNIKYFGEPVYTYSLIKGIEDGYLAPYKVIRVKHNKDEWRPVEGQLDDYGNTIPDRIYNERDWDRIIESPERIKSVAKRITRFLKENGRDSKTIVFCQRKEHAQKMTQALINENQDEMRKNDRYIMTMVSDDGADKVDAFCKEDYPVVVTTAELLSTGVDCKTVKLIVLDKHIESKTLFKQIVGRGTRLAPELGKYFFTIMDFRGATRHFYDPNFDGDPVSIIEETDEDDGEETPNRPPLGGANHP